MFYFGVIVGSQKSRRDCIGSFCTPLARAPLLVTFYITAAHLSKLRKQHGYISINQVFCGFHHFFHEHTFLIQRSQDVTLSHVSSVSSGLGQFLRLPLLFMTLAVLMIIGQVFNRMSLILVCLMFFLMINKVLVFLSLKWRLTYLFHRLCVMKKTIMV